MLAKEINEDMKVAAAKAIAKLAREDVLDEVVSAYGGDRPKYGKITSYHQLLIQD